MGFDIFSNNSNTESLEKRKLFFSNISNQGILKRSSSRELKISEKYKNYFNQDYSNEDKEYKKERENPKTYKRIPTYNNISSNISSDIVENNKTEDIINHIKEIELNKDRHKKIKLKFNINQMKLNNDVKYNTIFIFDWDDTLFFTSHLHPDKNNLFFDESPKEKKMMKSIEFYVEEILIKALNMGTVFIITNSSEGWVEACTHSYYPNLISLLKKINIISARALYEEEFPAKPLMWKIKAFNDIKERFSAENYRLTNIICIGDDNSEIIAAKSLSKKFDNCLIKTIKLRESPELKELIKQLILVSEQILRIYSYPKSLTIHVSKIKNPKKNI